MIKRGAARYVTRPRILHGLPGTVASAQAIAAVDSMWAQNAGITYTLLSFLHQDLHIGYVQAIRLLPDRRVGFAVLPGTKLEIKRGSIGCLMRQRAFFRSAFDAIVIAEAALNVFNDSLGGDGGSRDDIHPGLLGLLH